jgi:tetratricopeptide (TPR) repeat protein
VTFEVHYIALLENGVCIDNTRERNKPEKYVLGENQIIRGLEKAISSMRKNELSRFTLSPKYAEHFAPKRPPKYSFLSPVQFGVPSPSNFGNQSLIFEIELIDFDLEQPYRGDWTMTKSERKSFAASHKEEGNVYFGKQEYKKALKAYTSGYRSIREDIDPDLIALKVTLLLNMAACCIHIVDGGIYPSLSKKCVDYCTDAIKLDPSNVKGYYRRAQAYIRQGEFDKAETDLKQGLEIAPQNSALQKELTKCKQLRTQEEKRLKKMYSGMFS